MRDPPLGVWYPPPPWLPVPGMANPASTQAQTKPNRKIVRKSMHILLGPCKQRGYVDLVKIRENISQNHQILGLDQPT